MLSTPFQGQRWAAVQTWQSNSPVAWQQWGNVVAWRWMWGFFFSDPEASVPSVLRSDFPHFQGSMGTGSRPLSTSTSSRSLWDPDEPAQCEDQHAAEVPERGVWLSGRTLDTHEQGFRLNSQHHWYQGGSVLEAMKNESPTRPQDRGFRKVPEPPTNTSDFKDVLSPPAWFLPIQVPPPQVHLAIPLGLLDHPWLTIEFPVAAHRHLNSPRPEHLRWFFKTSQTFLF